MTDLQNKYQSSKETMFGIDRGSYSTPSKDPNVNEFWKLIDATNASKPLNQGGWKWNYIPTTEKTADGKSLVNELKRLGLLIMENSYKTMKSNYLSQTSRSIIDKDAKLTYYFGNATWNGAGWFKSFASTMNECADKGVDVLSIYDRLIAAKINNQGYKNVYHACT
jgi:hypothetical protein